MEKPNMRTARTLRELMGERNLTANDVARLVGVTQDTVYAWMSGKTQNLYSKSYEGLLRGLEIQAEDITLRRYSRTGSRGRATGYWMKWRAGEIDTATQQRIRTQISEAQKRRWERYRREKAREANSDLSNTIASNP